MITFIAKRLALLVITLLGVLSIVFILSRLLPGSPVEMMLGSKPTAEQIAKVTAEMGLDRPILVQYFQYVVDVLHGDFGISLRTGAPVLNDVLIRLGATVELVTLSIFVAMLVGLPLGILAAVGKDKPLDHLSRLGSVSAVAMPVFFLGILLQLIFAGLLGWTPLQGRIDTSVLLETPIATVTGFYLVDSLLAGQGEAFKSAALHLILPVLTLSMATVAIILRVTRNLMVEVLGSAYVRTVQAYGMPNRWIYFRYALKPVLVPLLTVVGLTYGYMLGGSVIVEYVFAWPGIGAYVVDSVITNDFPAVMGVTIILATAYLTINLLIDLAYFALDPRVKLQ